MNEISHLHHFGVELGVAVSVDQRVCSVDGRCAAGLAATLGCDIPRRLAWMAHRTADIDLYPDRPPAVLREGPLPEVTPSCREASSTCDAIQQKMPCFFVNTWPARGLWKLSSRLQPSVGQVHDLKACRPRGLASTRNQADVCVSLVRLQRSVVNSVQPPVL